MKIIKTEKDNKTITEIKFSGMDYSLIFGIIGSIKFIVKCFTERRKNKWERRRGEENQLENNERRRGEENQLKKNLWCKTSFELESIFLI